jgi:hypothetical protein
MVASSFDALMKSRSLQVVMPPSTLVEVLNLPKTEARDRIIEALAKGPRHRLPTEAQSMSDEIVSEARRIRPGWMRSMPDKARIWSLNNRWTKKIWRATLEDSGPMHEYGLSQAAENDAMVNAQRIARRDFIATTDFYIRPLTALTATPRGLSETEFSIILLVQGTRKVTFPAGMASLSRLGESVCVFSSGTSSP